MKPSIAVYVTGSGDDNVKRTLTTHILNSLVSSQRYTSGDIDAFRAAIVSAQNRQQGSPLNDEQIRNVGRLSGVSFVCVVNVTPESGSHRLSARIIDVATARVVIGGTATGNISNVARRLVENMFPPPPPQVDSIVMFFDAGLYHLNRGNYGRAIRNFDAVIRRDPNNAGAYFMRGLSHSGIGDYDGAIADYTHVIRLTPNDANAYINRGVMYSHKGNHNMEIADYETALRLDPNNRSARQNLQVARNQLAATHFERGEHHFRMNDYDKAIVEYSHAIRLNSNYDLAYNNRGVAYYNKGDYNSAIADFNATLRINPSHVRAKQNFEKAREQQRQQEPQQIPQPTGENSRVVRLGMSVGNVAGYTEKSEGKIAVAIGPEAYLRLGLTDYWRIYMGLEWCPIIGISLIDGADIGITFEGNEFQLAGFIERYTNNDFNFFLGPGMILGHYNYKYYPNHNPITQGVAGWGIDLGARCGLERIIDPVVISLDMRPMYYMRFWNKKFTDGFIFSLGVNFGLLL